MFFSVLPTTAPYYAQLSLEASWRPIRIKLGEENKIGLGLTLKGLCHTVATILAEMGMDERTIADVWG